MAIVTFPSTALVMMIVAGWRKRWRGNRVGVVVLILWFMTRVNHGVRKSRWGR